MLDFSTTQDNLEKLDILLLDSILRYEDILALLVAGTNDQGGNDPATLEIRGTAILQLQEQAALADHDLIATLTGMEAPLPAHLSSHPLMIRRRNLMQQVLTHSRSLLSALTNIKSLLAHEIKEMQGGRVALNGYRQTTSSQNGGILNHVR
ncbi:MAG: hypothetical protein ABIJ50_08620 [Pseudomonadota bacterium]